MIPKPGGGERPLGIPTIRDRVVQTAVKLVIEPVLEVDLSPYMFGYRLQKSALDAIKMVQGMLKKGIRPMWWTLTCPSTSMPFLIPNFSS